uniref:Uncharacterized protein n=1 Tax=Oryza glumipatula TaxID=40148 RepID=A0A0E0AT36_9ORYZ
MMGSSAQFAALGSNIVAKGYPFSDKDGLAVVYDTKTAAQAFMRRLPEALERWDAAVAAGNKLYAFTPSDRSVDCRPRIDAAMHRLEEDPSATERWSWSHDPSPVPYDNDHAHRRITSHAVRPGGGAIFVSVENWSVPHPGHGDDHVAAQAAEAEAKKMARTFSYDTERGEWTRHGDWLLPFRGEAHYDGELDAWVGLHSDSRRHGKLCSCDVVAAGSHEEEPNWKLCEVEVMTSTVEDDAMLVPMGGGGRFCLVEGRSREWPRYWRRWGDGDKCELRVTTFRLRYGKNGELAITDRRPSRSYILSRYVRFSCACILDGHHESEALGKDIP